MAALGLLLGVGVVVRAYRLTCPALSNDECFSWRLIRYSTDCLIRRTAADVHPPLYYLLLQGWLGVWGDSPAALRGFSVFLGALCIPMAYLLCREACARSLVPVAVAPAAARGGALFCAFLVAIHLSQVAPSQTARMYSQGVFLAALSAWLLLRALRPVPRRASWWAAYGVVVAAFSYTHYFAFFTVAAQAVFVAGDLLTRTRRHSLRQTFGPVIGFVCAGAVALFLYIPWLPVFRAQQQTVWQGYWISPVTADEVERVLLSWSTGLDYQGTLEARAWFALLSGLTIWALWRGGRAGWFFFLQAAVPWLLCLGLSLFGGRSILVERYLAFAQFFLLGLWAVAWTQLPGTLERTLLTCLLGGVCVCGLVGGLARLPAGPPAVAQATTFLKENVQAGDRILVDSPAGVDVLRYYAAQVGFLAPDIRCRFNPSPGPGHVTHVAALAPEDLLWPDEPSPGDVRRCWRASETNPVAAETWPGMRLRLERTFTGPDGTHYSLGLYERHAVASQSPSAP